MKQGNAQCREVHRLGTHTEHWHTVYQAIVSSEMQVFLNNADFWTIVLMMMPRSTSALQCKQTERLRIWGTGNRRASVGHSATDLPRCTDWSSRVQCRARSVAGFHHSEHFPVMPHKVRAQCPSTLPRGPDELPARHVCSCWQRLRWDNVRITREHHTVHVWKYNTMYCVAYILFYSIVRYDCPQVRPILENHVY
jgi:hypothetical protein